MSQPVEGPPGLDVLVVDVGARGVRARRGDSSGGGGRLDLPDVRGDSPLDETALVQALMPLVLDAGPPAAAVWVLPTPERTVDAARLLHLTEAHLGVGTAVVVEHGFGAVAGALDEVAPGVVLEMDVGAAAFATDVDQVWRRLDGGGFTIGERGSAGWLGAQGLAAALRHRDGVPAGSAALYDAAREALGDDAHWPDVARERGEVVVCADFAARVADAARVDELAEGLCRMAAEHLADTVCAGGRLVPGAPLAATGALLLLSPVKRAFAAALARRQVFLVPALGDSLAGGGVIARHLAAGGALPHRPPHVYGIGRHAIEG